MLDHVCAAVEADRRAAVVAVDQALRVLRIDPHDRACRRAARATRENVLAAVDRPPHLQIHHVHGVLVARVGRDDAE